MSDTDTHTPARCPPAWTDGWMNEWLCVLKVLRHPNVVELKDYYYTEAPGEREGEKFLHVVMEFIPETAYRVVRSYVRNNSRVPMILVKVCVYLAVDMMGHGDGGLSLCVCVVCVVCLCGAGLRLPDVPGAGLPALTRVPTRQTDGQPSISQPLMSSVSSLCVCGVNV